VRGIAAIASECARFVGGAENKDAKITSFEIDTSAIEQLLIDIANLRTDVTSNDVDIANLVVNVTVNGVDIADLRTDATNNDVDIAKLRTDVTNGIADLVDKVNTNIADIAALTTALNSLKDKVDRLHPCGNDTPGEYYIDSDGDSYGDKTASAQQCPGPGLVANNLDCNDSNAAINPGAAGICDGVDNNCDGRTDENLNRVILCGQGECRRTQNSCINGESFDECTPGLPSLEICDGKDNDCNGFIDETRVACDSLCSGDGSIRVCDEICPVKVGLDVSCECTAECIGSLVCCDVPFSSRKTCSLESFSCRS